MATTAYPRPICLSCATPSAKGPSSSFLPRSCFKTSKHRPFLIFSIVSVGGSPLSDHAIKPRKKRRHRSSGGGKVFCSISDGHDYPQIATSYGIDQVPTVLLFKDGNKVESITGTLPKSVYVKAIERNLS